MTKFFYLMNRKAIVMLYKIRNLYWWLMHRIHPRYRYHIVRTGLTPNYYDEDTLILHSCMALLERYINSFGGVKELEQFNVELRSPDKDGQEEVLCHQADRQQEAIEIYLWFKYKKPIDERLRDGLINRLFGEGRFTSVPCEESPDLFRRMVFRKFDKDEVLLKKELDALEEKIQNDEQQMLHRLIDIRNGLWT